MRILLFSKYRQSARYVIEKCFYLILQKDTKLPCFRLGLAEKSGRTPKRGVHTAWNICLSPSGWVSSETRWWPRAYIVQWPWWHAAAWRDSNPIMLPCHLSGTTAWTTDMLRFITTSGTGGKGHLNQSLNRSGWTLSSCLALFTPQLFFWKENESSGDHQDVSLHRQVFQKGWSQEINKKTNPKPKKQPQKTKPPFKTLKTTRATQPQDLKKLPKKPQTTKTLYALYIPFVCAFHSLMLWVVSFISSSLSRRGYVLYCVRLHFF